MRQRTLGASTLKVSTMGYGAMALIHGMYGPNDEARSLATLRHVVDRGVTLIDTADAYGADGENERLVGQAIAGHGEVSVATKWGVVFEPSATANPVATSYRNPIMVDGRPERARSAAETSLRRLGRDVIDLWYLHFPDPMVPIEETVGAMGELVTAGLVRHLGVSNVTADQLRAAHAAHPITAVQSEWSLWTREVEAELVPTARQLGVGIVPWGPLGTGFLAGNVERIGPVELDFRHNAPRFAAENLARNVDRFGPVRQFAEERGVSQPQLALAWLLAQGDDIVPIPGSRTPSHIDENISAVDVELTDEDLAELDRLAPAGLAAGASLMGSDHAADQPVR